MSQLSLPGATAQDSQLTKETYALAHGFEALACS